jgi:uncharacterized protein (DUF1778 family)
MMEQETINEQEVKQPVIGEFKPKRAFLNFVSAVNGARVRFIRDIAFVKGEKLSGTLEGIVFKITICDEGTINFEEVDTNVTDAAQRQRLIDDIDSTDVTGYAQKYVVAGIQFADVNGDLCYLEVEQKKPIDILKSIFDEEEKPSLSNKGMSFLDDLLSGSDEVEPLVLSEEDAEIFIESIENPAEPNEKLKGAAESYLEQQFRKMNEDKINELKNRIEDAEKESARLRREISMSETKLKKQTEDLGVLETRLDSFNANDESLGYVFYVSEEQKPEEIGLTEENRAMADKIADIVGLKKDVLFKMLTEGYYKIRIAEKSDMSAEKVKVTNEALEKMKSLVNGDTSLEAKVTMTEPGHFEYRGTMNWHQIVGKMIRKGFEQEPEFDKICQSNSYDSHEEEKATEMDLGNGMTVQSDEGFVDMGNGVYGIPPSDSTPTKSEKSKTPSVEIKSKDLRTYNEETTLVVMGTIDHNDNRDVEITDDYTGFEVYIGDKKMKGGYESDGFISIMTLPEFAKWQKQYPDVMTDGGGVDSFLLPNFKGTIGLTAMVDGEFTSDFDLSDYIQHQDGMDEAEVFLTLPEGTQIVKMDDYHQVPVAAMRDIKIDKLINVNKILTKEQLETVEHIKKSGIDITKNWFIFDTQSDEFAESEDFKFWVTIQLEEGDDQDPMCEDFLPDTIKNNLHNYAEVVFGYDGDLSEEEFIKELNKSNFFTYTK